MEKDYNNLNDKLEKALEKLKEFSQGRAFDVGTKVIYKGKFGVVTDLNKNSTDVEGSTIDLKMEDGTAVSAVSISSPSLQRFRA